MCVVPLECLERVITTPCYESGFSYRRPVLLSGSHGEEKQLNAGDLREGVARRRVEVSRGPSRKGRGKGATQEGLCGAVWLKLDGDGGDTCQMKTLPLLSCPVLLEFQGSHL